MDTHASVKGLSTGVVPSMCVCQHVASWNVSGDTSRIHEKEGGWVGTGSLRSYCTRSFGSLGFLCLCVVFGDPAPVESKPCGQSTVAGSVGFCALQCL